MAKKERAGGGFPLTKRRLARVNIAWWFPLSDATCRKSNAIERAEEERDDEKAEKEDEDEEDEEDEEEEEAEDERRFMAAE